MKKHILLIAITLLISCSSNTEVTPIIPIDETIYFPPTNSNEWETITANSLNWNTNKLDNLYQFLEDKNTKGFIILKNGKIVIEKYFNGHSQNATNQWFSAVKSLTATAIGIAQDENLLDISSNTSNYLGDNWSSLTQEKEDLITLKHHLTMTTGLVNNPADLIEWTCTASNCMNYNTDAGTTWAYHQGAFSQLQKVLSETTGLNFKAFIKDKILDKIGASGSWQSIFDVNIFSSNTRSMAKFGLLSLNKGTWNNNEIVSETYFNEMTNTSQNLNKAYGYLWWLNGKDNFIATDSNSYQGEIIPAAPIDMFAALGAKDQKIYVIPSKNMVVIRCGESAGNNTQLANSSFDNELWTKINEVIN